MIPFVGNLSDKIGRRIPVAVGAVASGALSFAYLYAISIHSVPLAILFSLLMWGVVYQGYNAVFPSFYPELFQTRTRVSGMAISQHSGTNITALQQALFATVGAIAFGITVICALSALSARETFRLRIEDLGHRDAVPVDRHLYDQLRAQAMGAPAPAGAAAVRTPS